jgi:hypothetical protein
MHTPVTRQVRAHKDSEILEFEREGGFEKITGGQEEDLLLNLFSLPMAHPPRCPDESGEPNPQESNIR